MHIPHDSLDLETLTRLLSEIVTRDGTDYGLVERSTEAKVAAARKALSSGTAQLHWDEESETASLLSVDQVREQAAQLRAAQAQSGIGSGADKTPDSVD